MKEFFLIIFLFTDIIFPIKLIDVEKIRADILKNHNYHRKRHQVDNLERNSQIESIAQDYSEYLASIDQMKHSGNSYGENLYYCWASNGICVTGEKASQSWYDEVSKYDFNNPGFSSGTGHFTQLVWKGSKQIGCGAACNSKNKCYVTCNYNPAGNYNNQYKENVFPLLEEGSGMSTAGKVFLSLFIIVIILMIAFLVYFFVIKKRSWNDLKLFLKNMCCFKKC